MPDCAFDHDAGFQESTDETQDLAVSYAPSHAIHQTVWIDGVETALDVAFDNEGHGRRAVIGRVELFRHRGQCIVGISTTPEPIRGRIEEIGRASCRERV